jgi:hypothetical protein
MSLPIDSSDRSRAGVCGRPGSCFPTYGRHGSFPRRFREPQRAHFSGNHVVGSGYTTIFPF